MKKVLLLYILVLILFIQPAAAQIEEELNSNVDSTRLMVINQRQMMLDQLKAKDYTKVRDIYQSLEQKTLAKENSPFDYTEYLYLNLLLGDWHTLTEFMKDYNESENILPYSVDDQLKNVLIDQVVESSDSILIKSQHASIDEDGKSVIQLFTQLTKNDLPDSKYYKLLDQHNKKYRNSPYVDFVNNYLPEPRIKSAGSLSIGSGMIVPHGKFAERFSQRLSFYASIDGNYKRLFGSLYFQAAGMKLEKPFTLITKEGEFSYFIDDIFNYQDFGLKAGYFLVRSNRFHMGPYLTINGIVLKTTDFDVFERLSQRKENGEDSEFDIISSFSFGPGFHTEIKLVENHKVSKDLNLIDSYVSLRADVGYNNIMTRDKSLFKGNTSYFNISLVFGGGIF